MQPKKDSLVIAREQLEAADGTSNTARASLLTQAATVHALIEIAEVLSDICQELENIKKTQER